MEAKELRIGNLVNEVCDGLLVVDAIYSGDGDRFAIESNGELHSSDFFKPIPLTEEWLLKFGLKDGYFGKKDVFRVVYECRFVEFSNKCENQMLSGVMVARTGLYVHTFQNLFFALTGKELQIKE